METSPIFNLEVDGFKAVRKSDDDRTGLFCGGDTDMHRWQHVHFSSVSTSGDGACGLHGQRGWPSEGALKFAGGQLRLREHLVQNLPSTFAELRGRVDVQDILVEDIDNMFWQELTVPVLDGTASAEGAACWKCLEADLPDVAAVASAFHWRQKSLKQRALVART